MIMKFFTIHKLTEMFKIGDIVFRSSDVNFLYPMKVIKSEPGWDLAKNGEEACWFEIFYLKTKELRNFEFFMILKFNKNV